MTQQNPISILQSFMPQSGQIIGSAQAGQNMVTQGMNQDLLSQQIAQAQMQTDALGQQQNIQNTVNRLQELERQIGFGASPEQLAQTLQGYIAESQASGGNPVDSMQALQALQQGGVEGLSNVLGQAKQVFQQQGLIAAPAQQDVTGFTKDLMAAGIAPGSEEFKAAVLEKYGKGQTIGYDVIEGVNPETGRAEYYQVSRVNPDEKIPLGIAVPKTAAEIKQEAADEAEAENELTAIHNTLGTIGKILGSPGLSGFSGLDQFRSWLPGSEAANVRAWMEQLNSQNFLTSVTQMKGMGALSENEGKKLSAAVAALSPSMSDDAIRRELEAIQSDLLMAADRIETGRLVNPDGTLRGASGSNSGFTPSNDAPKTVNWSDLK